MSDTSQGHGWWQASDGKWYAPETHPNYRAQSYQPPTLPQMRVTPPQSGPPPAYPTYPAAMPATTKRRKSRKHWWILGAGTAIVAIIAISAANTNTEDPSVAAPQASEDASAEDASAAEPAAPVATDPPPPPAPQFTASQANAIRAAEDYLEFMAFSRQGLIDQLSSEYGSQFPIDDATFAVDVLNIDWNEQAVKSAQSYLDTMPFSCQGLIDQLASEYGSQFTIEQAQHGATGAGIC